MRDAQSKLDQVIAFTGKSIDPGDVSTVLGLVGRDLLFDAVDAVADGSAPAAFAIAGRAVELGYDLRLVCRELARMVRDLLVVAVDPARLQDPEIAGEGERDRLKALSARFSREDLLRAFDVLTRAETDIRAAAQPRYHLEMALLRWIYLRKLTPIEDLLAGSSTAQRAAGTGAAPGPALPPRPSAAASSPPSQRSPEMAPASRASAMAPASRSSDVVPTPRASDRASAPSGTGVVPPPAGGGSLKDSLLSEIRKSKAVFYNTVVAQAQKIEVAPGRVLFSFSPTQRTLRDMFEQNRGWLESVAEKLAGRKVTVESSQQDAAPQAEPRGEGERTSEQASRGDRKSALKEQALADAGVQALLEVFPAEIRDVEEM
jgi:DNA polymerase-3 subunit gamma/tau